MKATIDFDPILYRELKVEAARSGTTIRELIDQAARRVLSERAEATGSAGRPSPPPPSDTPWFGILRDKIRSMPATHDMDAIRESIARGRRSEWHDKFGAP